jgi:MSHA biogenesis protein MshP
MFRRFQRGFAIVSAIFLLVVLAALGGFIATVSTTQHVGSAQDVQGDRVYYAARAGIEWGLFQALKSSSCVASSSFVYSAGNISVTVDCNATLPDEAGAGSLYTITATAG